MEEMKKCPSCYEEINAKAIRCPRCQSWQSKWRLDQSNLKHQLIFATFLIMLFGSVYYLFLGSVFNPVNFKEYKSLIKITDSKFHYSIQDCGARISIIGKITNNSDKMWKDLYFEVQFFNDKNELIDTVSEHDYDLVLTPEDKSTFKIKGAADKGKNAYHRHNIIIKSARESSGVF